MAGATGRLIVIALACAVAGAGAVAAYDPVQALAGRYGRGFANGMVDGSHYRSENIAEIVPVDAAHAYLRFDLQFYNGHSCGLAGIATRRGDALVYTGRPEDGWIDGRPCTLTVRRQGTTLVWDDANGTCKAECGARGSFSNGALPWSSKRPIRYLARLKRSVEYREAIAEWREQR
ncbi:hypothetical protein [Sphingomonas sp.]|uniref:hypothetical protein n=1 Tax=Sphingomonas sp. TaxID=28214 RepID=UPI003B000F94